jgi:hypothetical protein
MHPIATKRHLCVQPKRAVCLYLMLVSVTLSAFAESIVPIVAYQETVQTTTSTSTVTANCETSPLANGVDYTQSSLRLA